MTKLEEIKFLQGVFAEYPGDVTAAEIITKIGEEDNPFLIVECGGKRYRFQVKEF